MSQALVEAVGAGAAVASTSSFIPQLIKLLRERQAEAVSVRMYLLTVTAFALWLTYGLMLHSVPLAVSNAVSLALSAAILVLKLRYRDRRGSNETRPAPHQAAKTRSSAADARPLARAPRAPTEAP